MGRDNAILSKASGFCTNSRIRRNLFVSRDRATWPEALDICNNDGSVASFYYYDKAPNQTKNLLRRHLNGSSGWLYGLEGISKSMAFIGYRLIWSKINSQCAHSQGFYGFTVGYIMPPNSICRPPYSDAMMQNVAPKVSCLMVCLINYVHKTNVLSIYQIGVLYENSYNIEMFLA